jgi:aspartyl-tRNA(Asn)/glutamyl-tRNA(Gln) amidotransferase subunit C
VELKLTKDAIEHIAELARLDFIENEKEELAFEMEKIISHFDKLDEVDTSYVKATEHVIPLKNVFREDEVESSFNREEMLKNAPEKEGGCFKVPKILE